MGIITFSDSAEIVHNLDSFSSAANAATAIASLQLSSSTTDTAAGLELIETIFLDRYGGRTNVPDVAIVITYGVSSARPGQLPYVAVNLRQKGVI